MVARCPPPPEPGTQSDLLVRVRGVVQGDSLPGEFIPRLVDYIMDGKFPIAKMVTFYDFADINLAAEESSTGMTIKPVLRMPASS